MPGITEGEVIRFGRYLQNSAIIKPIEWRILSIDDGQALLLSNLCLDAKPYNENEQGGKWSGCSLRKWLNGEFLSAAFTNDERKCIREVFLNNPDVESCASDGNDTYDRVFCLSENEVKRYMRYVYCAHASGYAREQRHDDEDYFKCWWLRSPCTDFLNNHAVDYSAVGYVDTEGSIVPVGRKGSIPGYIRPALWLNTNNYGNTEFPDESS